MTKRKIVIDDKTGMVENIIECDDSFSIAGKTLIKNDNADFGWSLINGELTPPEDKRTLEERKAALIESVKGIRVSKIEREPFIYNGKPFQVGIESQKDMLAIQMQFIVGAVDPHGGFWRSVDNEAIPMDSNEVLAFFQDAFAYVYDVKKAEWRHRENIAIINSIADIEAYDLSKFWP